MLSQGIAMPSNAPPLSRRRSGSVDRPREQVSFSPGRLSAMQGMAMPSNAPPLSSRRRSGSVDRPKAANRRESWLKISGAQELMNLHSPAPAQAGASQTPTRLATSKSNWATDNIYGVTFEDFQEVTEQASVRIFMTALESQERHSLQAAYKTTRKAVSEVLKLQLGTIKSSKFEKMTATIRKLEEKVSATEARVEQAEEKVNEERARAKRQVENVKYNLFLSVPGLQAKLACEKAENQQLDSTTTVLREQLSSALMTINNLKSDNEELQKRLDAMTSIHGSTTEALTKEKRSRRSSTVRHEQTEEERQLEVANLTKENNKKVAALEAQLAQLKEEKEKVLADMMKRSKDIENALKEEIERLKREIDRLTAAAAKKNAEATISDVQSVLTSNNPNYDDPKFKQGVAVLKKARSYVKPICGGTWNEWSATGECQVCHAQVDRHEKGLHCSNGGHRICWRCMSDNIDWDALLKHDPQMFDVQLSNVNANLV